jgi:beta-lactamase class A
MIIIISDNTAADMLINLVGRSAVEKALSTTGMSDAGSEPAVPHHPRDVHPRA